MNRAHDNSTDPRWAVQTPPVDVDIAMDEVPVCTLPVLYNLLLEIINLHALTLLWGSNQSLNAGPYRQLLGRWK